MDGHANQPSSTRAAFKNPFGSFRHRPPKEEPVKVVPVPTGTVASRISYIQSLASGTPRKSPTTLKPNNTVRSKPSPKHTPNVDADRGGPSRQASLRIGYTARHTDDSNQDPKDEKGHSHKIIGWQVKRAKNDDSEDKSINSNSSSKKGFRAKVKDVFTYGEREKSPEIVTVNVRAVSISVNKGKDLRKDFSWETEKSTPQAAHPPSSTAVAPSRRLTTIHAPQTSILAKVASRDFAEEALISGRKVHNWLAGNGRRSEDSFGPSDVTTSTDRIRSVQQMYSSYGIPEPSELFSQPLQPSRVVGKDPRRCHVCKWINVGVERCSCCGHRICGECTIESNLKAESNEAAETARLLLETDDEVEEEEEEEGTYSRNSISQLPRKIDVEFKQENWTRAALAARKRSSRQSPLSVKKAGHVPQVGIFQERFDLPQKHPSVVAYPYTSGDGTSPPRLISMVAPVPEDDSAALHQPLREQRDSFTRSPPIPPEVILEYARTLSPPRIFASEIVKAHRKSIVKDSPFLKADQSAGNKAMRKLKRVTHKGLSHVHSTAIPSSPSNSSLVAPVPTDVSNQYSKQSHKHLGTGSHQDDMSSVKCGSPTCRATDTGRHPYRHIDSCSWVKATVAVETIESIPTTSDDMVKTMQTSALIPKPLSPVKRKTDTDETKAAQPAVTSMLSGYTVKENTAEKPSRLPVMEAETAHGRASPFSKAVVSVRAMKTELISPMGSDGQDDEHRAPSKTPQQNLHPHGSSPSTMKQRRSHMSSSSSCSPTITSTGQIITRYETSIIEHPPNSKHGRCAHQKPPHGHAPSSDPPHTTRSSAERSHEELVRNKHQAHSHRPGLHCSKPHSNTALGFCPTIPHTHIIERSTEYIECHPETQSAANTTDIQEKLALKQVKRKQRHSGLGNEWRELKRREREREHNTAHGKSAHRNVSRDSIDHGTFTTIQKHRMTDTSDNASGSVPAAFERQRSDHETSEATSNRQPTSDAEDDPRPHAHGAQNRLKQLGDSVLHRGNTVIHKGLDAHKRIVKPRMRLEERKKRVKYGDMDSSLNGAGHIKDSEYDTLGQPRDVSSGSDSREHGDGGPRSNNVSATSDEPEPSTRRRYLQRRQRRSDQPQNGRVYHRKDRVTHSRDLADDDYNREGTSFEHLATQPSFGAEYRHQSHPAQGDHSDMATHHQSLAGQETLTHRNTGLDYSDSDSYYEDNHSTMSGMSREIVFESGPHGQGPAALPVLEAEGRYAGGSDLEREQSRKINRAGLKMSKSVRHAVGAAGPVVPVAMPVTMEERTIFPHGLADVALDDEQDRTDNRADRAGLRMSNSVRHIVGADGSTSFSLAPLQQNPPGNSRYPSQAPADHSDCSGSLINPYGVGVPGAPTGPRAMREYQSYRPRRSDTPSPSSSLARSNQFRSQRYRSLQYSGGQASSEGEGLHHGLAPLSAQPYYYASVPEISMTEDEKIRKQSFSASKISLFEKLQNARPESQDRIMQIHMGTNSAVVPVSTSTRNGEPSEEGEVSHIPSQGTQGTAIGASPVAAEESSRTGKRRMHESLKQDASKRRKLSEDRDDVDVGAAAKSATASFFGTARMKAMQPVEAETRTETAASTAPAALRPSGRSVQSLREKFSLPTPDKSSPEKDSPPAYPNSFRRQRREEAIKNLMESVLLEEQEAQPARLSKEKVGDQSETLKSGSLQASTDGARSRINTVSTQKPVALAVVPEATVSEIDTVAEIPLLSTAKSKVAIVEKPKVSDAATKRHKLLRQLGFEDDHGAKAAAAPAHVEGAFLQERHIASQRSAPSTATQLNSPEPAVVPPRPPRATLLSKKSAKCIHCGQVVFVGSMRAHQERCAEEQSEKLLRTKLDEKAKKRAQKEKSGGVFPKHIGAHGLGDDVSVDEAPSRPASRTKSRLSGRVGKKFADKAAASSTTHGPSVRDDNPELAAPAATEVPARDAVKEPSQTVPARRGAVLAMAAKLQQPLGSLLDAQVAARKITTTSAAPVAPVAPVVPEPKKVSALGGADGATSTSPVSLHTEAHTKPPAEEMSIPLSLWLAQKFGMEVQELGEVTIEVGKEGSRKSLKFEGWTGERSLVACQNDGRSTKVERWSGQKGY